MADDHDTLLARADSYAKNFWHSQMVDDLAAALRESHANYHAALKVIARVTEGFDPIKSGDLHEWYLDPVLADDGEPLTDVMSDREWRVFCHAAQQATQSRT